ncbi:MAG: hybrid sensor histidine kinase/response regulator [Actinomycetota bacterium]
MTVTVLLCDTADGLAQLQYALIRSGADLQLEVTTDALRAVELAARTRPDVIVTELTLEGLGGAELIKRLRASAPGSRTICHSDVVDPRVMAEVLAAGAAGYVLREEGADEVLRAIGAAAGGAGASLSARAAALVAGTLGEALDDRERLSMQLAEIEETTRQGTAAKAEFLSNISHELRTPVTVAKGIAYVLRNRHIPDEEWEEFIQQLQASLDKLMMMVDEIITIAELERGTLELELTELDLAPLLRHAADEIGRQHPGLEIQRLFPDVLPAYADPARIGEVVREILDNGCRYSPEDRPVELRARALDEGVVVTVTDRGQGMQRTVAAQAFAQPFSTGEAVLRKEKAGVGVGLHLARQLIVQHGGILWTDPIPSGGTRVSFCIPGHRGETLSSLPRGGGDLAALPGA